MDSATRLMQPISIRRMVKATGVMTETNMIGEGCGEHLNMVKQLLSTMKLKEVMKRVARMSMRMNMLTVNKR
eukprot:15449795-Alexandrium_andersonii.AAC.1